MKRITWFVTGAFAGAGTVVVAGRRIKRRVAEMAPVRVVERAFGRTRGSVDRLKDAIGDGRLAMAEREQELRSRYLGEQPVVDRQSSRHLDESSRSIRRR